MSIFAAIVGIAAGIAIGRRITNRRDRRRERTTGGEMKLLGGIVPWIGFRESEVSYEDAEMAFGITQSAPGSEPGYWRINALEVEWLGMGMTLAVKPIQPELPQ